MSECDWGEMSCPPACSNLQSIDFPSARFFFIVSWSASLLVCISWWLWTSGGNFKAGGSNVQSQSRWNWGRVGNVRQDQNGNSAKEKQSKMLLYCCSEAWPISHYFSQLRFWAYLCFLDSNFISFRFVEAALQWPRRQRFSLCVLGKQEPDTSPPISASTLSVGRSHSIALRVALSLCAGENLSGLWKDMFNIWTGQFSLSCSVIDTHKLFFFLPLLPDVLLLVLFFSLHNQIPNTLKHRPFTKTSLDIFSPCYFCPWRESIRGLKLTTNQSILYFVD